MRTTVLLRLGLTLVVVLVFAAMAYTATDFNIRAGVFPMVFAALGVVIGLASLALDLVRWRRVGPAFIQVDQGYEDVSIEETPPDSGSGEGPNDTGSGESVAASGDGADVQAVTRASHLDADAAEAVDRERVARQDQSAQRGILYLGLVAAFAGAMYLFGAYLVVAAFLFALLRWQSKESYLLAVLGAAAMTLLLYVFSTWMHMDLPEGILQFW